MDHLADALGLMHSALETTVIDDVLSF